MSGAAIEWVDLHGGRFKMGNPRGDGYPQDGEMPVHEVSLTPFAIAATTVTNSQFASFVEETDYTTEAEEFGWSLAFAVGIPLNCQTISFVCYLFANVVFVVGC